MRTSYENTRRKITRSTVIPDHANKNHDERRRDIIRSAQQLFETNGIAKTSVQNITDEAGITRSLFYYYFPDKDAVVKTVLEAHVNEFAERISLWGTDHMENDLESTLRSSVQMLREQIFNADAFRRSLQLDSNLYLWERFVKRAVSKIAEEIKNSPMIERMSEFGAGIEYPYETFVMLIYGLLDIMRAEPNIPDEVLMKLIEQTLHLDSTRSMMYQVQK
jgi:TetR/AcrR family transcriptional regulator